MLRPLLGRSPRSTPTRIVASIRLARLSINSPKETHCPDLHATCTTDTQAEPTPLLGPHSRRPDLGLRPRTSRFSLIRIRRHPLHARSNGRARRSFHLSTPLLRATQASPFKLHDIGEGIVEVEIIKWHVGEGDEVAEFDPLCEVQSDKSVVELSSHASGTVRGIKAQAGETVKVGQTLCEIQLEGEEQEQEQGQDESITLDRAAEEGEGETSQVGRPDVVETRATDRSDRLEFEASNQSMIEVNNRVDPSHQRPAVSASAEGAARKSQDPDSNSGVDVGVGVDPSLLLPKDETMDLAGPSRLSGEASILPSPPSRPTHPSSPSSASSETTRVARREKGDEEDAKVIIKTSPAVRTLASRLRVDLAPVRGSGQGGRVTKEDVEAAAAAAHLADDDDAETRGLGRPPSTTENAGSTQKRDEWPEKTVVEFGRTRKVMFRALGEQAAIPHFGYSHTLDLTNLLPYLKVASPPTPRPRPTSRATYIASDIPKDLSRDPLAHHPTGTKTSLLAFLIKGLLLALEEHPIMRARVREGEGDRWLEVGRDGVIGVAVSDPKYGLLTPSLPALSPSTPLCALSSHLTTLRQNASKPSTPANLTISSIGGLGEGTGAMPVLPPGGGLAICAVGRAKWEVEWRARDGAEFGAQLAQQEGGRKGGSVWDLDEVSVKDQGLRAVLRVPVGWSADHRVLEGAELIAFTESWKKYIESPWLWLKLDG